MLGEGGLTSHLVSVPWYASVRSNSTDGRVATGASCLSPAYALYVTVKPSAGARLAGTETCPVAGC
jgi:hypothetical protein